MELIKWFVWVTTGLSLLGSVMLLNDGELDIYMIWNITALILASYYIYQKEKEVK